jgi:pentatricopeptide repeat protein
LSEKTSRRIEGRQASTTKLNQEIARLCQDRHAIDEAIDLLNKAEESIRDGCSYTIILQALAARDPPDDNLLQKIDSLFLQMKHVSRTHPSCTPLATAYSAVILAWSKYFRAEAGQRCDDLLTELWSLHNANRAADDDRIEVRDAFVPFKSTYIATLTALARSAGGRRAAQRAEELLEDMERRSDQFPHLRPDTVAVNVVLSAWSKSDAPEARQRCELILNRMEELYFAGGRTEMQPNATSFNTVIDALARSNERGCEQRAETLLERMDELSSKHEELRDSCRPDNVSFNSVLNCWARSRNPVGARRADAILQHMEQRYATGNTDIQPDVAAYNTVLTAWARSRDRDNTLRLLEVMQRMEKAYQLGNTRAQPNVISYNILINALAKSNDPDAADRALKIFHTMKVLAEEKDRDDCRPDCVTYTSLIDALAKRKSNHEESAQQAITLLEELEESYRQTGDQSLKPNIRTYTSLIQAIARSRTEPERAEQIVERLEKWYESGDSDIQPDCVCYAALINAFGWSNRKGKSRKCYSIYRKMLNLYKTRKNVHAKPDIITCNSVLNACAYEHVDTDEEMEAIMNVLVRTLEDFQSSAPKFGWPNHITYGNTLLAISEHVLDTERRSEMAETTFWQCCRSGNVSVLVITALHRALPWGRFSSLLGEALLSTEGEHLHFNWYRLPSEWRKYAPRPKDRWQSQPSRKRRSGPEEAKPSMARQRRAHL